MSSFAAGRVLGRLALASRTFARSSLQTQRRHMSAAPGESHAHASSDRTWQIASAVIFVPPTVYLFWKGPNKPDHGHGHADHHGAKHEEHAEPAPMKDSEGKEVSGREIKDSLTKAETSDAPKQAFAAEVKGEGEGTKAQAQASKAGDSKASGVKDSEGTEASKKEVADSIKKSEEADAPKTAKKAEDSA
ncbi:hypothetical protein BKA62DRAFT_696810 [Auriculariales sp. MPI-PUGE-AT-0066]|nr:hypothetical protein BKA62DRAFT_696810 [Auriculariales sp. MPI-PUGE-AT-0066]